MLSTISSFLRALDEHHINYCHWKSNEHLTPALEGDTDLDMLFDASQKPELESVFSCCGLKRFRATPLMQYNEIEDYIGFDPDTSKIWHVHTHYNMTLGEKHLKGYTIDAWANTILQNRILVNDLIWTADPADELVLLLSRIALKLRWRDIGHSLGKDDRVELAWLKEQVDLLAFENAISHLLGKSQSIALDLYKKELVKKDQFFKFQSALRRELRSYTKYNRVTSWIVRTIRELFWLVGGVKRRLGLNNYQPSRRISLTGGHVIAVLGSDGAGKSTTISYMKKEFGKKIDVVTIYFGSGDGSSSLIRRLMKPIARRVGGKGVGHAVEKEYAENTHISFKSRMYSAAKIVWAVSLAREKKRKHKNMIKARSNGLLVITDRYPQSIMPGANDGPLLNRYRNGSGLFKRIAEWEQRVYESFSSPQPNLAVKLMVPTEIAVSRKPEMTVEEIEKKKRIVLDMDIFDKTVIINTSEPINVTRSKVMTSVWELL